MVPVRDLLPDAVVAAIRQAPLSDDKVAFAWRFAAGPALARSATAQLANGALLVNTRDGAWAREIERSKPLIMARLTSVLGSDVITSLRVKYSRS